MDSIRDELEETGSVLMFDNVKAVFEATKNLGSQEALREFCAALAYYQRRHEEGSLEEEQRLDADDMERRFKQIRGFMKAYLLFEDQHRGNFPGEAPKDPRDRAGDMSACYFHIHEEGSNCTVGMDADDEDDGFESP